MVNRVQTLVLDMLLSAAPPNLHLLSYRAPSDPGLAGGFGHGPASPGLEPPDLHAWGAPVLCGVDYHTCWPCFYFHFWSEVLTVGFRIRIVLQVRAVGVDWKRSAGRLAGDDVPSSGHGHSARQELQVSGSVWVTPSEGEGCDDIARLS